VDQFCEIPNAGTHAQTPLVRERVSRGPGTGRDDTRSSKRRAMQLCIGAAGPARGGLRNSKL
jgi:hypothetical protein